jgi:hypothetical protein
MIKKNMRQHEKSRIRPFVAETKRKKEQIISQRNGGIK